MEKKCLTVLLIGCILAGVMLVQVAACLEGAGREVIAPYVMIPKWEPSTTKTTVFNCIPLEDDAYYEIIPLGNLNPPGHTFPSDHVYFVLNDGVYDVRAPADGFIIHVRNCTFNKEGPYQDYSIYIIHTNTIKSYFHHLSGLADWIVKKTGEIEVGSEVNVNIPVKAGDVIGIAKKQPGGSVCLDWGAVDYDVTLSFIHPEIYSDTAHAVCPLDYLNEDLREKAYLKVNRVGEPRGGKIDYDILGRLSGNWFLEGVYPWWYWSTHLAFVYYVYNASQMVVSVGGDLLSPLTVGVYNATGPDFREVSAESGVVTYHLVGYYPDSVRGKNYTLIVQVVDDEKIRVESFEGHQDGLSFTNKSLFYTRGHYSPAYGYLTWFLIGFSSILYYSQQQTRNLYLAACGTATILITAVFAAFKWRKR